MGNSASNRVKESLNSSPDFNSACNSVFTDTLSRAQHVFPGVKPYQLFSATEHLHRILSQSLPLISKWVPHPPDRVHVDTALKTVLTRRSGSRNPDDDVVLDEKEFKEFGLEVFGNVVVLNAGKEVLKWVPVGAVGILGVGKVVGKGKGVVAAAIGAYAVGVVTSVYLGLDG